MTMFVGDNPVIMSGAVVARRSERVVLGDGRGNTLTFDWTQEKQVRAHGSPSDVIIDLPLDAASIRTGACAQIHIEGKAVQVRYIIEPVNPEFCVISYTLCEDMRELLLEVEAPALAHKDSTGGIRIGMGPEGASD